MIHAQRIPRGGSRLHVRLGNHSQGRLKFKGGLVSRLSRDFFDDFMGYSRWYILGKPWEILTNKMIGWLILPSYLFMAKKSSIHGHGIKVNPCVEQVHSVINEGYNNPSFNLEKKTCVVLNSPSNFWVIISPEHLSWQRSSIFHLHLNHYSRASCSWRFTFTI